MSMLRRCTEPGCSAMTLGERCIDHELPRRTYVLVCAEDLTTASTAAAAAARAWPDARIVCDASASDPVELALEHTPDVLVLARSEATVETMATALVAGHGLRSVHVVLFTGMTERAEEEMMPVGHA